MYPLRETRRSLCDELLPERRKRRVEGIRFTRLQLEKDVLEGTAEILKKRPGRRSGNLTNKEKTILVDALKREYPLKELLAYLRMARSCGA